MTQSPSSIRRILDRCLSGTLVGLVGTLVVLVSYQVFSRYIDFIPAFGWTEEVSRGCFIWMVLIGASLGVAHGTHFAIEIITARLSPRGRLWIRILTFTIVLITAAVFIIYGWDFLLNGFRRVSLVTGLPMAWTYACLLVSGIFMALLSGEDLYREIRNSLHPLQSNDK